MAPVSMTLSDLQPQFQGRNIIQRQKKLQNGTRWRYIYNGRLIESRIWSIERCHF